MGRNALAGQFQPKWIENCVMASIKLFLMKRIKLFSAAEIDVLQSDINTWLAENKEVHILETNMTSLTSGAPALRSEISKAEYAFYILYTPANEGEEESVIAATKQLPEELTQVITNISEAN